MPCLMSRSSIPAATPPGNPRGAIPPAVPMISVLIAHDQRMFGQGLLRLFSEDGRFRAVGGPGTGGEAMACIRAGRPEVAVLALELPKPDGAEIAAMVTSESLATRCIILMAREECGEVRRILGSGARGCLLKEAPFEDLAEMVIRTAAGESGLGCLKGPPERSPGTGGHGLSPREEEVLRLVGRGLTSKRIAVVLAISVRTVDSHRLRIMHKLGIGNGPGLVKFAVENGLA